MSKYKIIAICQIYNEIEKGNLERFFKYLSPLVEDIIVYDDGSTDGSYEYAKKHASFVFHSHDNDFKNEIRHKELLVQKAKELKADFILWLDADEVLSVENPSILQDLCDYMEEKKVDGLSMHEINLWRSNSWQRVDSMYDIGWFVRLWKVTKGMHYKTKKSALHQRQYPSTVKTIEKTDVIKVIHYGFSAEKQLAYKYLLYKSHGQKGFDLLRIISEDNLVLRKLTKELFPKALWKDDAKPKRLSFAESLLYVERFERNHYDTSVPKLNNKNSKITVVQSEKYKALYILKSTKIVRPEDVHTVNAHNTDVLFIDDTITSIDIPFVKKVLYIPKESIYEQKVKQNQQLLERIEVIVTDSVEVSSFYRERNVILIPKEERMSFFWIRLINKLQPKTSSGNKKNLSKDTIIMQNQLKRTIQNYLKLIYDFEIILLKKIKHLIFVKFLSI